MKSRALLVLLVTTGVQAQAPGSPTGPAPAPESGEGQDIHWAYSSFLGTGYYRVSGDRDVYILDMPFNWDWRAPGTGENGWRDVGIQFDFPLTVGVHRLDFFGGTLDPENFGTLSFTPGVDLRYALSERWTLRGYAHAGGGLDLSEDERALIWDVGLRARYGFPAGRVDWGALAEVFHAGYNPDTGPAGSLGGMGFGAEGEVPVTVLRSADGGALNATWDLRYRWYADALTFRSRGNPDVRIRDEWRFYAGFRWRERPLRAWFFSFDRFSVGYRISSDGEFRGVTVSISAPLDR
ncbi:MAG: hypothetical protein V2I57_05805 [Xanthomonadales bacterium]|jgi:hypothetical protein|nr:hypothetical protein [Xanthomonadales bacterium]